MIVDGVKVTRREFLKLASFVGGATVMSQYSTDIAKALEMAFSRSQVVILDGQACEGCAVSLLQGSNPDLYTAVQLGTSIEYLLPVSPETGKTAAEKIDEFIESPRDLTNPKVLVVEGAVPMAENGRFQTYWDYRHNKRRTFKEQLKEAAEAADVIVAIGTTASYGGIPRGSTNKYGYKTEFLASNIPPNNNPTGAVGIADALKQMGVDLSKKFVPAVVNLPGCPVHPDHFFLTVADLIFGNIPELDKLGRPKAFYGRIIHDQCQFRGFFDKGEFLTSFDQYSGNFNDPFPTKEGEKGAGCLLFLGCKGPVTFTDCPSRQWNSLAEGVSWPNQAGVACTGCANPEFPDGKAKGVYIPLSEKVSQLPKPPKFPVPPEILSDNIGGLSAAVAGGAIGVGAVYPYYKKKDEEQEEGEE